MAGFAPDKLLQQLCQYHVDFIVIGGVAAGIYGLDRQTFDLDVLYRRSPENIANLVAALTPLEPYLRGAPPGLPFQFDVETVKRGLNFTFTTTMGDIDILSDVPGNLSYDEMLGKSIELSAFGCNFPCISLEHLILLKKSAGRQKDLLVLSELEALYTEQRNPAE